MLNSTYSFRPILLWRVLPDLSNHVAYFHPVRLMLHVHHHENVFWPCICTPFSSPSECSLILIVFARELDVTVRINFVYYLLRLAQIAVIEKVVRWIVCPKLPPENEFDICRRYPITVILFSCRRMFTDTLFYFSQLQFSACCELGRLRGLLLTAVLRERLGNER